jgi:hypothetical protein
MKELKTFLDKNKPEFENYVRDKRIVIVGPSEHLLGTGYGDKIDYYDIVVRINRALFIHPKYQKDIGTRTDILSSSLFKPPGARGGPYMVNDWKRNNIKWIFCPLPMKFPYSNDIKKYYSEVGEDFKLCIGNMKTFEDVERNIKTRPNTGLATIFELLTYDIKEIHVCGFSFYTTKYIESYTTEHARQTIFDSIEISHKQEPQRKYFFELMEKHEEITIDPFLQKLYTEYKK